MTLKTVSVHTEVVLRSIIVLVISDRIMVCSELAITNAAIIPGIKYMPRTIAWLFSSGTALTTDIISISIEVYAKKPYTPNSIIDKSAILLLTKYIDIKAC